MNRKMKKGFIYTIKFALTFLALSSFVFLNNCSKPVNNIESKPPEEARGSRGYRIYGGGHVGLYSGKCSNCGAYNEGRSTCWRCGTVFSNYITELPRRIEITTNDPDILADLVKTNTMKIVRDEALKKIEDKALLDEIMPYYDPSATEKVDSQAQLFDIALSSGNEDVRKTAIRKITNKEMLAEIVKEGEYWDVRMEAVKNPNIADETLLTEIAKTDLNEEVRAAAVLKLTDQQLLSEIIKKEINWNLRLAAYERLRKILKKT